MSRRKEMSPEVQRMLTRRRFVQTATAGAAITALGGAIYLFARPSLTEQYENEKLADGRPRLPPGQRVISKLKDMGGQAGSPDASDWRFSVGGQVERPMTLDFRDLLARDQVEQESDVHCVTSWSVMGARWVGVRIRDLAEEAGLRDSARYAIFEAAHGYTTNVPLVEALRDDAILAHKLDDDPLEHWYGGPVRGLIPSLYFWKSAKWITGVRFSEYDQPGYWEVRGYHNYADPWKEERYG